MRARKEAVRMTTRSQFVLALEKLRESAVRLVKASDALLEIARGEKEKTQPSESEAEKKETKLAEQTEKPVSLAEVRALLAEKSRDGFTAEIRAVILAHGANKLSEIDPSEYAAVMKDAEGIGNG